MLTRDSGPCPQPDLTERERQVLALVIHGLTDKEIGYRLGISARCVREHVSRSAIVLGANNRAHLGAIAVLLVLVGRGDAPMDAPDHDPLSDEVAELVDQTRASLTSLHRPGNEAAVSNADAYGTKRQRKKSA